LQVSREQRGDYIAVFVIPLRQQLIFVLHNSALLRALYFSGQAGFTVKALKCLFVTCGIDQTIK
jgi:hypothetical protein